MTVRLNSLVREIDTGKGEVLLDKGESLPYDELVVATGATATKLDIPGADKEGVFVLKTLRDGITIKNYINEKSCRRAIIIGAGFISMEMSEGLRNLGIETEVIYRGDLPVSRWDPEFSKLVLDELGKNNVSFITKTSPLSIEGGNKSSLRLITDNGNYEGDLILMALGVRPNTELARNAGIAIGTTGAVRVDVSQRTSGERIYSVGDCAEVYHRVSSEWVYIPLGDIANKQGRVAGSNIGGNPMEFKGVVGAQSFKVFGLELAATGLDEKAAQKVGFDTASMIIWGTPVARSMNLKKDRLGLKLIADRKTGKLLGAQAIGESGAVGRINTLSACLWAGMDLDEVGYLDLAYSPPFGGAWDTIQIAAQALKRKM
ncbi:MAG: FAD-dependent oxidoreductase [Deltaproteobacteria bacterium]|nr:FAD-dependent oxidoreductase [Deltaproteobacteria bacterium]MBN2846583.1 FAD-dependent oxidoreductase [Deltaproteobacteria bacterium]